MPRYYFHVHDGMSRRDRDGTDLPDLDAARKEALQCACEILQLSEEHLGRGHPWRMLVTDAQDQLLLTLRFEMLVSPLAAGGSGQTH